MKTKYYFSILTSVLLLCSCSEKTLEPITGSLGKPGVVTDVKCGTAIYDIRGVGYSPK